jgi:hypothetical protein
MKQFILILFALPVFSCNNTNKKKDVPASENSTGVQNVNGNIPDTTNAISLGSKTDSTKTDSSFVKDSLKK